jgi:hypothetical protein
MKYRSHLAEGYLDVNAPRPFQSYSLRYDVLVLYVDFELV